jgi:hypothetical protein
MELNLCCLVHMYGLQRDEFSFTGEELGVAAKKHLCNKSNVHAEDNARLMGGPAGQLPGALTCKGR